MKNIKGIVFITHDYNNKNYDVIHDFFHSFQLNKKTNFLVNKINELHKYDELKILSYKNNEYDFNNFEIIDTLFNDIIKISDEMYCIRNEDLYNIFSKNDYEINDDIYCIIICYNITYMNEFIEKFIDINYVSISTAISEILSCHNDNMAFIFNDREVNDVVNNYFYRSVYNIDLNNNCLYFTIDLQKYIYYIHSLINKTENIDEIKKYTKMITTNIDELFKINYM